MKDKNNKFFNDKDLVIENLRTLKISLEDLVDVGFSDPNDVIYNELLSMIDDAKGSDSELALSEVIERARVIETKLDSFYSHEGIETTELSWPQI